MKCSEIHEGLPQKEIRDFLSQQMVKAFEDDFNNEKKHVPNTYDGFDWAIRNCLADIEHQTKLLENLKTKQAIMKLVETNGWIEHDVSDEVYNDTDYKLGMSFIGTDEEHNILMKQIYPNG
jgi:hypothetical protein